MPPLSRQRVTYLITLPSAKGMPFAWMNSIGWIFSFL
jgi:hypothetical protein